MDTFVIKTKSKSSKKIDQEVSNLLFVLIFLVVTVSIKIFGQLNT
jgi:hypothetical protein